MKCKDNSTGESLDVDTFRQNLKTSFKQEFSELNIRVNKAGCLSFCERGINVVVYPQGKWFHDLSIGDETKILNYFKTLK